MSPWEDKPGGGRRWKPPTAEQRKERGLSELPPTSEFVSPATRAVQAGDVIGGGMSPGFAAKHQEALAQQQAGQFQAGAGAQFGQPQQQAEPSWWERTKERFLADFGPKAWEDTPWGPAARERLAIRTATISKEAFGGVIPPEAIEPLGYAALLPLVSTMKVGLHVTKESAAVYRTTGEIIANSKTTELIGRIIAGGASTIVGGVIIAAGMLGSMFWGMYAGAEAPESPNIVARDVAQRNQLTGDWSEWDEFEKELDALYEATDPELLKNQLPGVGLWKEFNNKWKGNRLGWEALKKLVADERAGLSEAEIWEQKKEADATRDKATTDYINDLATARDKAKADRQEELARLYDEMARARLAAQIKHDKEMQEFWLEYLKLKKKMQEDIYGRSHLGFGLLR